MSMYPRTWLIGLSVTLLLDRGLKLLALNGVEARGWGLTITLFKNDQLVFSLPSGSAVALAIMLVGCAILLWLVIRHWKRNWQLFTAAAVMLTGAASNLYDRLAYGFVIDWAYIGDWWPVFNLADVMVMVGLVLYLWRRQQLTPGSE